MTQKRGLLLLLLLVILGIPLLGLLSSTVRSPLASNRLSTVGVAPTMMAGPTDVLVKTDDSMQPEMMAERSAGSMAQQDMMITKPMPGMPSSTGFAPGEDRAIVKTANMSVVVSDTRETVSKVQEIAKNNSGLVTSSNVYERQSAGGAVQANMVLRVPVDKLESVLSELRGLASKVLQDSMNAEDRTKQKVDLEARIKNLRASEEQLMTIMKQAKNVQETLEVQRQLTQVREQVEMLTAELENLSNDADMSTIYLNISTKEADLPAVGSAQNSIFDEIKLSVQQMIRLYRTLFIGGIRIAIIYGPLLILFAVAWMIWQRRARKS